VLPSPPQRRSKREREKSEKDLETMPYYTRDEDEVDDFDEFDPTPYSVATLSPPQPTKISSTRDLNSPRTTILPPTPKKLSTPSTAATPAPSPVPDFDPVQPEAATSKVRDPIRVTVRRRLSTVGDQNRGTAERRRRSMAGDLSRVTDLVATVADRSLVAMVGERRLSMAGDLNLDMVGDRRVRPGMVKRGASMSVSLAMEGLRKTKEATGSLAMGDLRIRLRAT